MVKINLLLVSIEMSLQLQTYQHITSPQLVISTCQAQKYFQHNVLLQQITVVN